MFQEGPLVLLDNQQLSYLVVYGGLDGDVTGADGALGDFGNGFRHYDRATCPKAMVFLHHCDHNRFNTVWKSETTGFDESGVSLTDLGPQGRLLSEADHRTLAIEYIGGFMRWRLKGEDALSSLFTGASANSLHAEATFQWSFGKREVFKLEEAFGKKPNVKVLEDMENRSQGTIAFRAVVPKTVGLIDQFADLEINGVKQASRTLHQTGVLAVNPNLAAPTPAVLRLTFAPPDDQDWSGFHALALRVTADFDLTDLDTIANGRLPEFEVVLIDTSANRARLDQSGFNPPLTRPVFHELRNGMNITRLKLQTLRAPLANFQGVHLDRINVLEIHPGPNFPRHMFFDSLELFKER